MPSSGNSSSSSSSNNSRANVNINYNSNDTCPSSDRSNQRRRRSKLSSMPSAFANPDESFNVDYFSHPWDEMDLKASWSVITKHKHSHMDGARLENASWRKWMQKRFNLKKISPEALRWKKEEDITWLYGPFCRTNFTENLLFPSSMNNNSSNNNDPDQQPFKSASLEPNSNNNANGSPLKKSSLKTRSVVNDLKKFQIESDVLFHQNSDRLSSLSTNCATVKGPFIPKRINATGKIVNFRHSISDTDLTQLSRIDNILQLSREQRMLLRMINQQDSGFVTQQSSFTKQDDFNKPPTTQFQQVDKRPSKQGRLRFSSEVEVLEYDEADWQIIDGSLNQTILQSGKPTSKVTSSVKNIINNVSNNNNNNVASQQPYRILGDKQEQNNSSSSSPNITSSPTPSINDDRSKSAPSKQSSWMQYLLDYTNGLVTKVYK